MSQSLSISPLMTAREVAALLRVSVRKLWRMVETGQIIRPVNVGVRGTRWRHADIEEFVAGL